MKALGKKTVMLLGALVTMLLLAVSALAADSVASGTCGANGDNLTWALDSAGTLTIQGSGEMRDYKEIYKSGTNISNAPWWEHREAIQQVVISGASNIGEYAFYECTNLSAVSFAGSSKLESIGKCAFYNCTSMTEITLPDGVTSIGEWAFDSCTSLTEITIPERVTSIGSGAFYGCTGLTNVYITDINAWCRISFGSDDASPMACAKTIYLNGERIVSVDVPQGVASLNFTFFGFRDLVRVAIPDSVTSIGVGTFGRCTSLTEITLPDGVTSIGGSAFYGCTSLTEITLPDSVTSIGTSAFSRCTSLTTVNFAENSKLTNIGRQAFNGCTGLTNVYITDINAWCRIPFDDATTSPMAYAKNIYLNGERIVSVDVPQGVASLDYTFYGFRDLIRVTIPGSVTSIGGSAFSYCTSLTTVNFAEDSKLTNIGGQAFQSCTSLANITIPDSVTSIGSWAFNDCTSLTTVTFAESSKLTDIGDWAFYNCTSLMSIALPDSLTSIGRSAFADCTSLMSITFPGNVASTGIHAFSHCTSLKTVAFAGNSKLKTIDGYAFNGCTGLTEIAIPAGVTSIGSGAFSECTSLANITIPDSVTSIGNSAFSDCSSLTSIAIPSGVTSIGGGAFGMCGALKSVHITDVGAWCGISFGDDEANPLCCAKNLFINGTKAETLEIPANVKVIPVNAFVNAKCIQRVALSEGLVGIAANAFSGCTGIETVFYAGSESAWEALPIGAGNDCLKNAQIFYGSTLDDYYCRITVKISDGGCIRVDRNTAEVGDTITVTAEPYAGYGLTAIYVDGKALEGNTFTVQGNHEVSAVFTLLPAYGGTAEYRIEGITVCTAAGEKLQELMPEKLLVSVLIRHMDGSSGATVMLAQYDAEGRYQGLVWLTVDEMPLETALKVTLPLDNRDGKTINLKAFVVSSVDAPIPAGNAVSFGKV